MSKLRMKTISKSEYDDVVEAVEKYIKNFNGYYMYEDQKRYVRIIIAEYLANTEKGVTLFNSGKPL